jgi:hypothetical protein
MNGCIYRGSNTVRPSVFSIHRGLQVEGKWITTGVPAVSSKDELTELYCQTPYLHHPSLIQQRIEGNGEGIFGLFRRGKPCGAVCPSTNQGAASVGRSECASRKHCFAETDDG